MNATKLAMILLTGFGSVDAVPHVLIQCFTLGDICRVFEPDHGSKADCVRKRDFLASTFNHNGTTYKCCSYTTRTCE